MERSLHEMGCRVFSIIFASECHVEQLTAMIEDHMQLEAEKPTGRTFAPLGLPSKKTGMMPTTGMTYGQRRRVDKRNTGANPLALT